MITIRIKIKIKFSLYLEKYRPNSIILLLGSINSLLYRQYLRWHRILKLLNCVKIPSWKITGHVDFFCFIYLWSFWFSLGSLSTGCCTCWFGIVYVKSHNKRRNECFRFLLLIFVYFQYCMICWKISQIGFKF